MRQVLLLLSAVAVGFTPTNTQQDSYLKVKATNGYVQGFLSKSCRNGREFAGFRGIPYAEPPVEKLRFRSPEVKRPWKDVWNATYQRPSCIQEQSELSNGNGFSEDCLYLNVYTPNLGYLKHGFWYKLKPVMVFIHPGAFNMGSSSEKVFSPDFLIDQDIVLVTFNYRLGALGFLSLQNEAVPGNAGLKDQTLALRWVKENIKQFGGDPSKVTIFGESAGAASVNYHLLSKSSEGLFRSAIMQSGSVLSSWAYSDPELSQTKARKLATKVGCRSRNLDEVLACMQNVPADEILKHQTGALTLTELLSLKIIAFHPTTEPDVPDAFITDHPLRLMYNGNITKVPAIVGLNENEGLLIYPTLKSIDPTGLLMMALGTDLSRFTPYIFHVKPFTKPSIFAHEQISQFYFNSKLLTKALIPELLELVTDVMFTVPIQLTAGLMANTSMPVYNYFFTYDGGYNVAKVTQNIMKMKGVSHGDDLGYLFYTPDFHKECGKNTTTNPLDEIVIDRMTSMWANFAKTGDPTPKLDQNYKGVWKQFTSTKRNYLDIGENLTASDSLKLASMLFWEELSSSLLEMIKRNEPEP